MKKICQESMRNATFWIEHLELTRHPTAGHYRVVYESPDTLINKENQLRRAHTSIYYLLESHEIGYWRNIKSDETFHFYAGGDLTLHLMKRDGTLQQIKMGNLSEDQTAQFQYTVPANTWFALEVMQQNSYSLVACSVTPGFDYSDYEILEPSRMLSVFPQHAEIIHQFGFQKQILRHPI